MLATVVAAITTVLTCAGLGYYLLALWSARAFARRPHRPSAEFAPPVSILKPVKGLDHEMYAAFASHCRQHYRGALEILFGVGNLHDPAVEAIHQLMREFPEQSIRLVLCPETLGANGKVSNLAQLLPHARYEHIIINDSDILVSPQYVQRIMAEFAPRPRGHKPVGMVTAPYRGRAHSTIGSRMEALGIATDFIPGVLTARKLEGGLQFGLGSTLALSRQALEAAGGLLAVVDFLADDYELGARVHAAGYAVVLSGEVVETFVPAYRFSAYLEHQIRWSRSTRDSRRWGYAGLLFTYGLPWAIGNMIATGLSLESIALFALTLLARTALALAVGVGLLGDRQVLRDLWLLLPRDIVGLGLWIWSFAGDTVVWRGERFALRDGKLRRIPHKHFRLRRDSSRPLSQR